MATVDDFSRLVTEIYSAVTTPENWDVTLADLGAVFNGARAGLVITDGDARRHLHADLPADSAKSYAEHFSRLDHVLAAVETGPVGAVRTGTELMWPHSDGEFEADWTRPNGFGADCSFDSPGHRPPRVWSSQRRSGRIRSTPQNVSHSSTGWSPICSRRC
ncbi:MAG TPA: hypothetical protein VET27_03550 [Mycobacterium sp.]|nr:hypothetical protein [Mycobacterium sp.]